MDIGILNRSHAFKRRHENLIPLSSIKFASSPHKNFATSYLFNSKPTITTPTTTANHISATLLVAVMAPPATTGPTTALSE